MPISKIIRIRHNPDSRGGVPMSNKELKIPVEVYSRVVGYFRPVNQWNKGKQEEFNERKVYRLEQTAAYEYQGNL
jgi:hypothetical protein